jgi:hypothetical protein
LIKVEEIAPTPSIVTTWYYLSQSAGDLDGETTRNGSHTTIENFDVETSSYSTTTENFNIETSPNSYNTTIENFDGEITNSVYTTAEDFHGETISNYVDVNSVTTEETKYYNSSVNEETSATKEVVKDGVILPTTETTPYSARDETTTNECVTNLTTIDFLNTTNPNTSYSPDIDTDYKTTTSTTTEVQNNKSVYLYNSSYCICYCRDANATLQERVERIKSELTLEKKALSSAKNQRISAHDPRPTAKYVGVLGASIICVILIFIIGMDILQILQNFDKKRKRNKIKMTRMP